MKRGLECKQGFTEIFHEIVNFRWKIRQNALCYLNINKVSRFFFLKLSWFWFFTFFTILGISILDDTLDTNVEFVGFATISLCSGCGNNGFKRPRQVDNRLRDSCNPDNNHRRQPWKKKFVKNLVKMIGVLYCLAWM